MAEAKTRFPMYKGKPLVRCGDLLYYGDMKDNYVVRMQIKSKREIKPINIEENNKMADMKIADKVFVQLLNTDINVSPQKAVTKTGEQPDLFAALDIGYVWLQQVLRES